MRLLHDQDGAEPPIWGYREVAKWWGVSAETVRTSLSMGVMPAPDGKLGGRYPWWWPSTIKEFQRPAARWRAARAADAAKPVGTPGDPGERSALGEWDTAVEQLELARADLRLARRRLDEALTACAETARRAHTEGMPADRIAGVLGETDAHVAGLLRPPSKQVPRGWAELGTKECAEPGCTSRGISHGRCEAHANTPGARVRVQVGESSGFGRFGIVDRTDETVLCHECGQDKQRLEVHVVRMHGMTVAEYRDRHGLRAGDSLLSRNLMARFRETSLDRVGSPAWGRFERGRGENLPAAVQAAAQAGRGRAMAPSARTGSAPGRASVTSRACLVCGKTFTVAGSRSRETCSAACFHESKIRAAGVRSAARAGEEHDFARREGHGRRVRNDEVAAALGITTEALRARVTAGSFVPHAGREHAVKFWWQSDLPGSGQRTADRAQARSRP